MAYSTPITWVAGSYPTAAQFNANIRDNVSFLANPPACRVYHNATQSIATSGTPQVLAFNSERYDTATMHDTVTNNSRITCATAGLYVFTASVEFAANATGTREVGFRINGSTFAALPAQNANSAGSTPMAVSTTWKMAANDYMEVRVTQTSGGALNVQASTGYSCDFSATWIGLG